MKWAFHIDIELCRVRSGTVTIIARIEDPGVIEKNFTRLDNKDDSAAAPRLPPCRVPPQARLFD